MRLDLVERLVMLEIMPEKGNILAVKELRELREKLSPSAAECQRWQVRENDGKIQWATTDEGGSQIDLTGDIDLTDGQIELIKKALIRADMEEKLTIHHVRLWETFVDKKE